MRLGASLLIGLGCALGVGPAHGSDAEAGARAYQKCYACHSLEADRKTLSGPHLAGIVGRPAAAVPGFEYSDALIAAREERGLVWTAEALDDFLADPQFFLPGNAMPFFGMRNASERAALIGYLAKQGREQR